MKLFYLLLLIQAALASRLVHRNHSCLPSGYTQICILELLQYDPDKAHVIHHFPPNQSHVRIASDLRSSQGWDRFFQINGKLHTLLGKPKILEMQRYIIRNFELPRALWQGIFPHLYIQNLTVEPGTETPRVVYLDLSNNYLRDIANVSSLVNLEVLFLRDNYIESIDSTTMHNLTKLRILDMSDNYLTKVSMDIYPKSLIHLNLFANHIESLNYAHLYYPRLEVFNIEQNALTSIDGAALMLAMPKLRLVRLGWNRFDLGELQEALHQFQRHNISVRDEADEAACAFEEQVIEGVCVAETDSPRTVLQKILISLLEIVIVIALGSIMRWAFIAVQAK